MQNKLSHIHQSEEEIMSEQVKVKKYCRITFLQAPNIFDNIKIKNVASINKQAHHAQIKVQDKDKQGIHRNFKIKFPVISL
jgi:hypothetical protein